MKRFILVLVAIAVALPLWATAQAPDVLKLDGKTYDVFTNPLEPYLRANPQRLPQPEATHTGLWRGYIATWAIRDRKLFVEDVIVPTRKDNEFRSVMKELFGDGAPRVADWYSGHLVIPTGELVRYVHMGYGSIYSWYKIATVIKGEVRSLRDMNQQDFEAFRRAQFAAFKKTAEYRDHIAGLKQGHAGDPEGQMERFLYEYASEEYLSRIPDP